MDYDDMEESNDYHQEEQTTIEEENNFDPVEDTIDDTVDVLDVGMKTANQNRITTRYMTKYERARVLGTRALQIR